MQFNPFPDVPNPYLDKTLFKPRFGGEATIFNKWDVVICGDSLVLPEDGTCPLLSGQGVDLRHQLYRKGHL